MKDAKSFTLIGKPTRRRYTVEDERERAVRSGCELAGNADGGGRKAAGIWRKVAKFDASETFKGCEDVKRWSKWSLAWP